MTQRKQNAQTIYDVTAPGTSARKCC